MPDGYTNAHADINVDRDGDADGDFNACVAVRSIGHDDVRCAGERDRRALTPFDVGIAAENVTGLAASSSRLPMIPAILTAVGAVPGPFLTSTGRVVQCLGPARAPHRAADVRHARGESPAPPSGTV